MDATYDTGSSGNKSENSPDEKLSLGVMRAGDGGSMEVVMVREIQTMETPLVFQWLRIHHPMQVMWV